MIEKLGIFDSGLGGYSVYHDLMTTGPDIEYVLYADQKNAPYGNKSERDIIELALNAMSWFETQGIKHVLLACNTVSSIALDALTSAFPQMFIWGIVDLTLSQLDKASVKELGVVSTLATHNSKAYIKAWQNNNIKSLPLGSLVSLIEGNASDVAIAAYLEENLQPILDTTHLILACTHYPLVKQSFEKVYKGQVLDSRLPIRAFIQSQAHETQKKGTVYTTGDANMMGKQIDNLFGTTEKVWGI